MDDFVSSDAYGWSQELLNCLTNIFLCNSPCSNAIQMSQVRFDKYISKYEKEALRFRMAYSDNFLKFKKNMKIHYNI